ncbi:MAG: hypothetical protein WC679_13285, partial [Bacteroidales bacterium]
MKTKKHQNAIVVVHFDHILFPYPRAQRLSNIGLTLNALNWRDSCTTLRCSSYFTEIRKNRDNSVIGSKQVLEIFPS